MPGQNLTNSEWYILDSLWEQSPMTVMELAAAMEGRVGWAKSTTLTVLTRMEAKGLIRCCVQGRSKQCWPAVERRQAARQETRSFLDRVYRGSVGLMLSAMTDSRELSREEIAQLYDILRRAEEET